MIKIENVEVMGFVRLLNFEIENRKEENHV